MLRKATLLGATLAGGHADFAGHRLRQAEVARRLEQGRGGVQERQVLRRGELLPGSRRARSEESQCARVSGHGVHDAVDSGRESPENMQFATKAKDEFGKVLSRTRMTPSRWHRWRRWRSTKPIPAAGSEDGEAGRSRRLVHQAGHRGSQESRRLLQPGRDRAEEVLSRTDDGPRGRQHEAGRPGPLKDKKAKAELSAKYAPMIDDGIKNLQKALDIDPESDDAMAYMNLLIRERPTLADDKDDYKKQIEEADTWLQKALDTKKAKQEKAEKKTAGGIVQE